MDCLELRSLTIENMKMKQYMGFNSYIFEVITCKKKIPLIFIHTKYCFSTLTKAKKWKISCSKCNGKLRNEYIWHCRCEEHNCKSRCNFCQNCYNEMIKNKHSIKSIIKSWSNKDVKKWIINTKWLDVPNKDMDNFKQFVADKIFNNITGDQLLMLTKKDIITLSKQLSEIQWQNGFKNMFFLSNSDKAPLKYTMTNRDDEYRLINGYFIKCMKQINPDRNVNIGEDVVMLIAKFMTIDLILEQNDLKLLTEEKEYIFDSVTLKQGAKLMIGQNVNSIQVLNDLRMEWESVITSTVHYEKPANIDIKCGGDLIMEHKSLIDVSTFGNINAGDIDIQCNSLKMDINAKMNAIQCEGVVTGSNRRYNSYHHLRYRYGNIRIHQREKCDNSNRNRSQFKGMVTITDPGQQTNLYGRFF